MIRIDFEGIDGSGKTTQLEYAYQYLLNLGVKVVKMKEVGNPYDASCLALRDIILKDKNLSPLALQFICLAMREQNQLWLEEQKKRGVQVVLSDRGLLSHYVYGTVHCGEFEYFLKPYLELSKPIETNFIFLDISTKIRKQRLKERNELDDVVENRGDNFFNNVQKEYSYICKKFEASIIDGNQSVNAVSKNVEKALDKILEVSYDY